MVLLLEVNTCILFSFILAHSGMSIRREWHLKTNYLELLYGMLASLLKGRKQTLLTAAWSPIYHLLSAIHYRKPMKWHTVFASNQRNQFVVYTVALAKPNMYFHSSFKHTSKGPPESSTYKLVYQYTTTIIHIIMNLGIVFSCVELSP